jgi:hypothetical protein
MLETNIPRVKYSREEILNYIVKCREDEGIPIFKTRFAGIRFDGVFATCWAGRNLVGSVFFEGVPEEDTRFMEEGVGDWRRMLEAWGTPEQKSKAYSKGIYIMGYRIPRFIPIKIKEIFKEAKI